MGRTVGDALYSRLSPQKKTTDLWRNVFQTLKRVKHGFIYFCYLFLGHRGRPTVGVPVVNAQTQWETCGRRGPSKCSDPEETVTSGEPDGVHQHLTLTQV